MEFEKILNEYKNYLFKMIYSYIQNREDSEDILQEVFLKLYVNLSKIKEPEKLKYYLIKLCRSKIYDFLRKKKRQNLLHQKAQQMQSSKSSDSGEVLEKLNFLPKKLRDVLILKDIQNLSYKEISKVLNMKVGTVQTCVFKARNILRRLLK